MSRIKLLHYPNTDQQSSVIENQQRSLFSFYSNNTGEKGSPNFSIKNTMSDHLMNINCYLVTDETEKVLRNKSCFKITTSKYVK